MIEYHKDLNLFFYELLQEALKARKLNADPEVEHYLLALLGSVHTEAVTATLLELQQKALQQQEVSSYKSIGDCALTRIGIFEEYLTAKHISTSYVEMVGSQAYQTASNLAKRDKRAPIFYELGSKFPTYARVLDDIKEATSLGCSDPLKLYEKYINKNSTIALNKLNKLGLVVNTTESEA